MRNATTRALAGMSAAALFLAAQTALAQQTNGCPAGQAMQSSDPSGKRITCVPIPDVSGLQGQISEKRPHALPRTRSFRTRSMPKPQREPLQIRSFRMGSAPKW